MRPCDSQSLTDYLSRYWQKPISRIDIKPFHGGQSNPTYLLDIDGFGCVLRKKPDGKLLPSAHQIEREYRVMKALGDSDVPVPTMLLLCEDTSIIGTAFYLMEYIPGQVLAEPDLPSLTALQRTKVYQSLVQSLAALHQADYRTLGLSDFGKTTQDYYPRQIKRWTAQYLASCDVPAGGEAGATAMKKLIDYLPTHCPSNESVTLVHGDYRLGNVVLSEQSCAVSGILDWELATLGDPLADVAYCCIPYHLPGDMLGIKGLMGLDLAALGIPDEATFLQHYCHSTGRQSIENWPFYVAFSLFRLAAILQGVYHRALQGNASSRDALEVGQRCALLAVTAAKLLSLH